MTEEAAANEEIELSRKQRLMNAIGYYSPKAWGVAKYFVPYGLYKAGKKTKKKVKSLHAKYKERKAAQKKS